MDRDAFVNDVETGFKKLPPALINDVATVAMKMIGEYREVMGKVFPELMATLMPHINAIGFEKAMGYLNLEEVEADVMEALKRVGIAAPKEAA